ncbi:ribokinase [Halobacillus locisalis]|uniref:Ribokinase n=1 Tax=Halobacillus locisalis TaxID=220753 RepID=A0A838CS19_9BACI|nr:ribokinase [Halobacillus locisalis]MBA2174820.1 ribokinase [Halobacillus locisalis]
MRKVTVIGSINMDLTVTTKHVPDKGETVLGDTFATFPGGKGANQAVAAARLGADVSMIGAVGADSFGEDLLSHLSKEGINIRGVNTIPNESTGTATIIIHDGDNRIIVAPGANHHLTPFHIERNEALISRSDVLLVQMEIPIETIKAVSMLSDKYNIPLIVNPAPYQKLPQAVLKQATYLTPNQSEARLMQADDAWIDQKMITTLGSQGVELSATGEVIHGYPVQALDTTGAGDTFNGALSAKLSEGADVKEAIRFANAASALSVQKIGAQSGMPTLEEVKRFRQEREEM